MKSTTHIERRKFIIKVCKQIKDNNPGHEGVNDLMDKQIAKIQLEIIASFGIAPERLGKKKG